MLGSGHLKGETPAQALTHPGQAHFADLLRAETCRECLEWDNRSGDRDRFGILADARCLKAQSLLSSITPKIPHSAHACRHFQAVRKPFPASR